MSKSAFDSVEKVLVVADLGRIRTFRYVGGGDDPAQKNHLNEVSNRALDKPLKSVGEVVTDDPGKFSRGFGAGQGEAMSHGEQHNLETEMETRTIDSLGKEIAEFLKAEGAPDWVLVAPQAALKRIQQAVPASYHTKLRESVGADLIKEPVAKLESRFLSGK